MEDLKQAAEKHVVFLEFLSNLTESEKVDALRDLGRMVNPPDDNRRGSNSGNSFSRDDRCGPDERCHTDKCNNKCTANCWSDRCWIDNCMGKPDNCWIDKCWHDRCSNYCEDENCYKNACNENCGEQCHNDNCYTDKPLSLRGSKGENSSRGGNDRCGERCSEHINNCHNDNCEYADNCDNCDNCDKCHGDNCYTDQPISLRGSRNNQNGKHNLSRDYISKIRSY